MLHSCPWIRQDDFNFVIQSKADVDTLSLNMQKLHEKGLHTHANYQALVDSNVSLRGTLYINTQEEFNRSILSICDKRLETLRENISELKNTDINSVVAHHATSLYKKLCDMRNSEEIQQNPRDFLHSLTLIIKALPAKNKKPTQTDIDELIVLGNVSKGHPSALWQAVGITMLLLGSALAIASGILLTLGTVGVATPAGIGMIAAGSTGVVNALTGVGLFAYSHTRTGLSKNIIDLAEAASHQPALS